MSTVKRTTRTWLILVLLPAAIFGKDIFLTRSGSIEFFSSAPVEDIKAINKQVSCVLDMETGELAFQAPIRGFMFKNALMQEHFNENYMESDKFPKAVFKGKIDHWSNTAIADTAIDVSLSGSLTIHGVTRAITETGQIWHEGELIKGTSAFDITVADYDIEIPKVVRNNIAKIVRVDVAVQLKKK
ncbi:MAG TPA: YceI family protein [Candidatus Marinimicrobia bacterium]|nr:YceI family protein [Candidatus Neomarinimicrobiota bacterium]